jgi:hypothetical protein
MDEFFRLVGVALLSVLTSFATTFYLERRKEQRAEHQEVKERDRQLRQALRLVSTELTEIYAEINAALEDKHWWTYPPHDLSQRLWAEYSPILANFLDGYAWDHLAEAYAEIACFNRLLIIGRDGKDSIHGGNQYLEPIECCNITEFWQQHLIRTRRPIETAIEALRPIDLHDSVTHQMENPRWRLTPATRRAGPLSSVLRPRCPSEAPPALGYLTPTGNPYRFRCSVLRGSINRCPSSASRALTSFRCSRTNAASSGLIRPWCGRPACSSVA